MYKCTYFSIEELTNPKILQEIGEVNAWARLDSDCLKSLDFIREIWGVPIIINSSEKGLINSGLRHPLYKNGAGHSLHRQGKSFDLHPYSFNYEDTLRLWTFCYGLIQTSKIAFNVTESKKLTLSNSKKSGWVHLAKMNLERGVIIS